MSPIDLLLHGLALAVEPQNFAAVVAGVVIGQILGVLPGIGPAAGMALLLPMTFGVEPVTAIVLLAGIMYGSMYGGTITSVLINVPGEAASVMTALDGNQMARNGRAGAALSVAAIGSFLAGTISVAGLLFGAVALSSVALKFSSPEMFLLGLIGLTMTANLGLGSPVAGLFVATVGLIVASIGLDPVEGIPRLTFGTDVMLEGIDFLPVAIGLFGIAEVIVSLENITAAKPLRMRLRELWLTAEEWRDSYGAIARGGIIGFGVGLLPGCGSSVAALVAYAVEKKFSRHPERFGKGAIDGVAASESANNSAVPGALVPMLALGIPGSNLTAILMSALILVGIRPGPSLMAEQPDLVGGLIGSMIIGNIVLLILNLPLAPLFAAFLRIPYVYLAPSIFALSMMGAYASTLSVYSLLVTLAFGMIGYAMIKAELPRAPLVLAIVLAPMIENTLRQSLQLSDGSLLIFVERPVSAVLALVLVIALALPAYRAFSRIRGRKAALAAPD